MQQVGVVLSVIGESESEELRGDLRVLQRSVEFCDGGSVRRAAIDRIDRASVHSATRASGGPGGGYWQRREHVHKALGQAALAVLYRARCAA